MNRSEGISVQRAMWVAKAAAEKVSMVGSRRCGGEESDGGYLAIFGASRWQQ